MRDFTDETLEAIAARFKALAEPSRLRILNALREGEKTVTELVEELEMGQANVSRHLSRLRRHRMVARRKEGTRRPYRIADPDVFQLCELVCGRIESELEGRRRALGG